MDVCLVKSCQKIAKAVKIWCWKACRRPMTTQYIFFNLTISCNLIWGLIVSNASAIFVEVHIVSMHVHHPIFSHVYMYWENVSTMLLLCKYQYIMDSKRKLNYTYITLLSHKWTSKGETIILPFTYLQKTNNPLPCF